MEIKKIIDFNMDQNCYIISNGNEAVLIDPGSDKALSYTEGIDVKAILLTHCHYDHIGGLIKLKEKTGAEIISGEICRENIKNPRLNVSVMFNESFSGDVVQKTLFDGEEIEISGMKIKCIATPGHTSCSVCYMIENNLFSGDTIFLRTTGRWDLPTGDFNTLKYSVINKIYSLDDDIKIYPGHGEETTVGYEKKFNMVISGE